jgi:exodeoxyribonuclease VII small subunit
MNEPKDYRKLSSELDTILENLQSSDLDVDQIITEYQKGIDIVERLEEYLKSAQNKITKINQKTAKPKK